MSKFLSKRFLSLEAYTPGEQPKDMQYIKLNTNESPFPVSESVRSRVTEQIKNLNLYPDPEGILLRQKLSNLFNLRTENVFLSNGSDEILSFAFMAFCDKNKSIAFPNITYGFYKVYAELYGIDYTEIPLNDNFEINYKDYCNLNCNIIIANPNAPTGLLLQLNEIEQILKTNRNFLVIIDEAYIDFGGKSCYNLINKYNNLLVVRTFSKSHSLAGARLGFALSSKEIIDDLNKIKFSTNPYNVNRFTLAAGEAAIEDNDYYLNNCKKIVANRGFTLNALNQLGYFIINSKANFLFVKSQKICGYDLYLKLKQRGILVRHFNKNLIADYVRITIGTKQQMNAFINAIKEIEGEMQNA